VDWASLTLTENLYPREQVATRMKEFESCDTTWSSGWYDYTQCLHLHRTRWATYREPIPSSVPLTLQSWSSS
jgi:hypothetical protein